MIKFIKGLFKKKVKRFEYNIKHIRSRDNIDTILYENGKIGWELIETREVKEYNGYLVLIFKREI